MAHKLPSIFLTSLFLLLVMAFPCALSTQAEGTPVASGTCGDSLTWTLDEEGTLTISGTGPMNDGYASPWITYRYQIRTAVLESGVTTVGNYAFMSCTELTSVSLPEGLTSIGDDAFKGCSSLVSINFPESLTSIGFYAFEECWKLSSIKLLSNDIVFGTSPFYKCDSLKTAGPLGGGYDYEFCWTEEIPAHAFQHCMGLRSVVIPDTVTAIGDYAFWEASEMTDVNLPAGLTTVGHGAFACCNGLTQLTIPASVTSLGGEAFGIRLLEQVRFLGSAPTMYDFEPQYYGVFLRSSATIYYPCGDPSWTAEIMRCGGTNLTWVKDHHFEHGICTICGQSESASLPSLIMPWTTYELAVGETLQASVPGVEPAALFWRTGNESKARVDEHGLVTARSQGNTYLYARCLDGRETRCLLKISDSAALTLPDEAQWLQVGETVTMEPQHVNGQQLTWSVGNRSIARVDSDGRVTGVSVGNTYLYVRAADGRWTKCLLKVRGDPIVLSRSDITMTVGGGYQIYCRNAGTLEVTWRTGNSAVATVNKSGAVTAVGPGNTWLYARIPDGQEARCLVRVKGEPPYIRYTEKLLKAGQSFQFTADRLNGRTVTWRTGNSAVAIVDQTGKVTGVSSGNTWLYCTASDGAEAKCLLRVDPLSIRYNDKTVKAGQTFQFTATGGTGSYTWRTGSLYTAEVDSTGKVTAKNAGNTYLYCTDSAGTEVKCLIKVIVD